jgi:hypothetical protein
MKVSDLISKIEFTAQSNLQNVFIHREIQIKPLMLYD